MKKDVVIYISTVNGTGSLSANQMMATILFHHGLEPGSCNFFPSNIAGLPCLYALRVNTQGRTAFKDKADLLINLNPKTLLEDLKYLKSLKGCLITDKKSPSPPTSFNGTHKILPFSLLNLKECPVKAKKFLKNIIYVGLISRFLGLDKNLCQKAIHNFLSRIGKLTSLIEINLQVFNEGWRMAEENPLDLKLEKFTVRKNNRIFIDGNSAAALGALSAGCRLLSWYPITPATSLAENFEKYGSHLYKSKNFTLIQAEDEMAALGQVLGAGWAGLRAMTSTSGPGLSLMAEGAGLSYFAEIPAVICNVQRAGPSTGLPTRTAQGDLLSACFLSHGDTKHIVLLPGSVEECFSLTEKAFELAEELQTLIILLSDLDLAMNLHSSPTFSYAPSPLKRGKVRKAEELNEQDFERYKSEKDGVSYRILPGTTHFKAGYLTRGSGHNEQARYSESPEDYKKILNKLKTKWEKAKRLMPKPVILKEASDKTFITFGKNESAVREAIDILKKDHGDFNYMRLLSYPFPLSVEDFLKTQKEIYVVEQNRDGQLKGLLRNEYPHLRIHFHSILKYTGQPFSPQDIVFQFQNHSSL